jgi:NAD/NADP transhydrogenase alpha subunit
MYGRNLIELITRMVTDDGFSVAPDDPVVGPAIVRATGAGT